MRPLSRKVWVMAATMTLFGAAGCDDSEVTTTQLGDVRIEVSPLQVSFVSLGSSVDLQVAAVSAGGAAIEGATITLTPLQDGIVSVSGATLTAIGNGQVRVRAEVTGLPAGYTSSGRAETLVNVLVQQELAAFTLSESALQFWGVGESVQLVASAVDARGNAIENGGLIEWTTNDPDVATVDASGAVQATGHGSAEVRARFGEAIEVVSVTSSVDVALELCATSAASRAAGTGTESDTPTAEPACATRTMRVQAPVR